MAKRANRYRLTLQPLALASGVTELEAPMQLEVENHDEIFGIVRILQSKNPFNDAHQAAEFAIGLKLFSEVMIRNRSLPLFQEFLPAFRVFMKKLKEYPVCSDTAVFQNSVSGAAKNVCYLNTSP